MIRIYEGSEFNEDVLLARRQSVKDDKVEQIVADIIEHVKNEGDAALREYCARFDHANIEKLRVSKKEIEAAWEQTDEEFRTVLEQAAKNIRDYHRRQLRENIEIPKGDGIILGQRFTPIAKVGIYVPGGTAAYPSSVLMNAIPASLAGCEQIVMVTPPLADGSIATDILAAARVAGVTDIYKVGGAQAIAALAYGTESIPAVDKIVGPGNIFVATAKKQVFGMVDIDMIAGPSEILVIADESARADYLAADMLSQAEHDVRASATLLCLSREKAEAVKEQLAEQVQRLPREGIASKSLVDQGAIIIVNNLEQAIDFANRIAPEHLELAVDDPFSWLPKIKNAGSIFLGEYTPEPLGDYWAGPNHVLPTLGSARYSSPLSVDDFVKRSSYIYYTRQALAKVATDVEIFASREGLDAHANSIKIRTVEDK